MAYEVPPLDPATEDALMLCRRMGCTFRLVTFFPGPGNPHWAYPIEVSPPAGFHFNDHEHSVVVQTWWAVTDYLSGVQIFPCDEAC